MRFPFIPRSCVTATLILLSALPQITFAQEPDAAPAFSNDFEKITKVPSDWEVHGNITIDTQEAAFKGSHSLVLSRQQTEVESPCSVVTSTFKTKPGLWTVSGGIRPDLYSPDSSFDGRVTLECLDAEGKVTEPIVVSDVFGKNGWNAFGGQYEIPKGTVASRLRIELDKTYGKLWIDELLASYIGEAPHKHIDRLVFSTVALGNMLYPTDSRVVSLSVRAPEEIPADRRVVNFVVCDYWGAEQMTPVKVPLKEAAKDGDNFMYEGSIDLASVPLEVGKYYEMLGEIPLADKPFRNHSGLAIEPEAVTNSYSPEETPFTGRNWDCRIPTGFDLSHRMGIRIMNSWSGWDATAPYTAHAPGIDLIEKYKMGVIFGTPSGEIEHQTGDWKKYDDTALREGMKNLLTTYGKNIHPIYVSLGNEPPDRPEFIANNVAAYKSMYEAAKAYDPKVTVISTSIGASENFFKGGFGKYCDAYDFHCYEDPKSIAATFQRYQEMFKKYGDVHPIWSTEIGLNSEGVSRHTVSIDMVKKFAAFFANGGACISWFDLFYPDPDAKNAGSNGESFDVFDSRYVKYNPKITAITNFDLINTISIKKFVGQEQYGDDIHAFLMRDKDNHNLQIIWKDAGRKDVFMLLPGAQKVEVIKLDGTHRELQAGGNGVTLTVNEEPLLVLYDGDVPLAHALGSTPPASLASVPAGVVRGGSVDLTVNLNGASADNVNLVPPPFWQVKKTPAEKAVIFTATAPEVSSVREAEMTVTMGDGKATNGELYFRIPVTPKVSTQLIPVPMAKGGMPGVKMVLKNNGAQKQDVTWSLALPGQITLIKGSYDVHEPTKAHFDGPAKGQVSIAPGGIENIFLPIAGIDPLNVYQVRAVVADSSGATAIRDRNLAGFVAVPKAKGEIKLDGMLDEADWKNAPVEKINEERQYLSYEPAKLHWKGPADLSGTIRYLWDDHYLYVGVEVTDDIEGGKQDASKLWAQDGLQFLVDPCRGLEENVGKYDYSIAEGKNGIQAWCDLSADAGAPNGVASDIKLSCKRKGDGTGAITYEVAFPWSRLAPFKPHPDADLGLTMILNEDDGAGRKSYMMWFGNASTKQVDSIGDLILQP